MTVAPGVVQVSGVTVVCTVPADDVVPEVAASTEPAVADKATGTPDSGAPPEVTVAVTVLAAPAVKVAPATSTVRASEPVMK
ncbi:hypothetical protein ASF96_07275 [Microbacterium sp. Leaf179]|nr:hypothetical protein ASF96_07275 [Microbacterium sp. Leaf179]